MPGKPTTVSVDTTRVTNMLNTLAKRAGEVDLRREGKKLAGSVRLQQTPRTGRLEHSIKVVVDAPDSVRIVSNVFYARFNWLGTSHQEAKPPIVGYDPRDLAKDVAAQIFWTPSGGFATSPHA